MVSANGSGPFHWSLTQSMSEELLPAVSGHSLIYSETPVRCAYLFGGWDGDRLFNDLWMFRFDE